jgi:hypothetical protein
VRRGSSFDKLSKLGQLAVVVDPRGHRLQLTADLVSGEEIEYAGLDRAFLVTLRGTGKKLPVVIAAIAREMAAFLWAIARQVAPVA